jgi:RecA-family ATPase
MSKEAIKKVAAKVIQLTDTPLTVKENIFIIRTANQCIEDAKLFPIPNYLFSEFRCEGELSILFAGAGIGKTIIGVQIANSISKGRYIRGFKNESDKQLILYFDFELSDKQFEKRYSDNYTNHYIFDDNFLRISINANNDNDTEEVIFNGVEEAIIQTKAKIVVIDNITFLAQCLEKSQNAGILMRKFNRLKKKYRLSMLVLAHTPKRDQSRPIGINDLAGSMQIGNFVDSIFAMNYSAKDKSLRYIKQIKARSTEVVYDTDNIIVCEIKTDSNFACLEFIDFGKETEHLTQISEYKKTDLEIAIIELKRSNPEKSIREIANELDTNVGKVQRVLQYEKEREINKESKTPRYSDTVLNI